LVGGRRHDSKHARKFFHSRLQRSWNALKSCFDTIEVKGCSRRSIKECEELASVDEATAV